MLSLINLSLCGLFSFAINFSNFYADAVFPKTQAYFNPSSLGLGQIINFGAATNISFIFSISYLSIAARNAL
jgi:hypothetical protein